MPDIHLSARRPHSSADPGRRAHTSETGGWRSAPGCRKVETHEEDHGRGGSIAANVARFEGEHPAAEQVVATAERLRAPTREEGQSGDPCGTRTMPAYQASEARRTA